MYFWGCTECAVLTRICRNNLTQIVTSPSFVGLYHTISEVNAHLSVPEKLWATWYAWWRNDTLATGIQTPLGHVADCQGIMSFVLHEVVYFGRSLPWIIIDAIPFFRRWKLQDVLPTPCTLSPCSKGVFSGFS
jgi:methylsterol monooxygenase